MSGVRTRTSLEPTRVYTRGVEDAEAWARLSRVLDICQQEAKALSADGDERLTAVLKTMNTLLAEIGSTWA